MSFAGTLKHSLSGWSDHSGDGANKPYANMATSWVTDLMQAAQQNNQAQGRGKTEATKLWFNGAGSLGNRLDLGINDKYISSDYQKSLYGDEWLLGLVDPNSVDLKDQTADANGTSLQKLKYAIEQLSAIKARLNRQWNAADAQKLAELLDYINREAPTQGRVNNQKEAMKDFLAVYSALQNDGQAGNGQGWDDLKITSAGDKNAIKQALFGNGTQAGGLIDANRVLLGGQNGSAPAFGNQLTAETLGAMMGRRAADVAEWVEPINEAIAKFDINTPQRLAAFLANVRAESRALAKTLEDTGWGETALAGMGNFKKNKLPQNNPALFRQYVDGTIGVGQTRGERQANYAYSADDGNGDEASGDGYLYRGRGLLQITRKGKYDRVTNGGYRAGGAAVQKNAIPGLNEIYGVQDDFVANPDLIQTKINAARSSAWYWRFESSWGDLNKRADIGSSNEFRNIVNGIHGGVDDIDRRKEYFDRANMVVSEPNGYGNMRQLLREAGLNAQVSAGYQSKIGLQLGARTAQAILRTQALESDSKAVAENSMMPISMAEVSESILQSFKINQSEVDMLIVDSVPMETLASSNTMVVAVNAQRPSYQDYTGVVGSCAVVYKEILENNYKSGGNVRLYPGDSAREYFGWTDGLWDLYQSMDIMEEVGKKSNTVILEYPKHGKLIHLSEKNGYENNNKDHLWSEYTGGGYEYTPTSGFYGADKATFVTTAAGRKIKSIIFIKVVNKSIALNEMSIWDKKICPNYTWMLSDISEKTDFLSTWQAQTQLSALIASATQSLTGFQSLAGTTLGLTQGEGTSATITLDDTAAGHGWYIDQTPLDNTDDYLPTSLPEVWQAKPGSAAEGKMDLLSVLLHEYGHVLGLEHSDGGSGGGTDFMAPNLQPGQRRLPTADELMRLQTLAAALLNPGLPENSEQNQALPLYSSGVFAMNSGNSWPSSPSSPLPPNDPSLPLGGLALAGWMAARRREEGSAVQASAHALSAIHPTLQTQDIDLIESTGYTSGQTSAAQSFLLDANQRYMSFTVDGLNSLGAAGAGPADALEVALLNANTYAQLNAGNAGATSPLGWSHSDALINLQRSMGLHTNAGAGIPVLQSRLANGVEAHTNPDGSITYRLDLAALQGHTDGSVTPGPVRLSFDLIGFGAANSRVHIRDIRYGAAPTAQDAALSGDEDTPLTLDLAPLVHDADGQSNLTLTLGTPAHGSVRVNADGTLTYTPEANWHGTDSFSYTVSDGHSTATATVQVSVAPVNDAPTISDISLTLAEDSAAQSRWIDVVRDVDVNAVGSASGTTLSISDYAPRLLSAPAHGSVVFNPDGSFAYTPEANWYGSDSFVWQAVEVDAATGQVLTGALASPPATVNLTITPVADAPQVQNSQHTLAEDASLNINLLALGADVDELTSTPNPTLNPATHHIHIIQGPSHGHLSVNTDGTLNYTPEAHYNGPDSVVWQLVDMSDVAHPLSSNEATAYFTITPINDAPLAQDLSATVAEDGLLLGSLAAGVTDIDTSTSQAAFTYSLLQGPRHGSLSLNANGRYTYRPDANWHGEDSFTWQVSDGQAQNDLSGAARVILTVTPVNDAPTLDNASLALAEDSVGQGNWLAAVHDVDADTTTSPASGTVLQAGNYQAQLISAPAHGTVVLLADGRYTYTPEANWFGTDSFSLQVQEVVQGVDGTTSAVLASNTATVSVTVSPVNDAPVASDLNLTLAEDGQIQIALWDTGSSANSSANSTAGAVTDIDSPSSAMRVHITRNPAHGSLSLGANGVLLYKPDANYNGSDSFAYSVDDGVSDGVVGARSSNTATVNLSITPVNDAPVIGSAADPSTTHISTTAQQDQALTFALPAATDVDGTGLNGAALTYRLLQAPQHGQVSITTDAQGHVSATYTPNPGYHGADSFVYAAHDGELLSNFATVSLDVKASQTTLNPRIDLGLAGQFNAFVFDDFKATACDVEGALAVGDDLNISWYSLNEKEQSVQGYSAVVGGDVNFAHGNIAGGANGLLSYGGQASLSNLASGDVYVKQAPVVNFAAEQTRLTALSDQLATLAQEHPTGTSLIQWGGLYLTGDGHSMVQVFNVKASQLAQATWSNVAGIPDGATVIVNVQADLETTVNGQVLKRARIREGMPNPLSGYNTLYNFADAQELNFEWVGLVGSVLAPRATIKAGLGVITGNVIAYAWDSGIQINTGHYFDAKDWPV